MKINQAFVDGFNSFLDDELRAPLTVTGDDDELVLRKGKGFDEWLADGTNLIDEDGDIIPRYEMNIKVLNAIVRAWLYGVEYEG